MNAPEKMQPASLADYLAVMSKAIFQAGMSWRVVEFLEKQEEKWKCPECGGVICCHNGICFSCGLDLLKNKKKRYRWEDD